MRFRAAVFSCTVAFAMLSALAAHAADFIRVCRASQARAEAFLEECKKNARPFSREFLPSGRGAAVPEAFAAWFDTASADSHFGFGCVLGPKRELSHFGLYFFVDRSNFNAVNTLQFAFIDFNGNVGFRLPQGSISTALAVHKLTPPGQQPHWRERNCDIGRFDRARNETTVEADNGFHRYQLSDGDPSRITICTAAENRFRLENCSSRTYKSFFKEEPSRFIYGAEIPFFAITEKGQIFADERMLHRICTEGFRSPLEYVNLITDLCSHQR